MPYTVASAVRTDGVVHNSFSSYIYIYIYIYIIHIYIYIYIFLAPFSGDVHNSFNSYGAQVKAGLKRAQGILGLYI